MCNVPLAITVTSLPNVHTFTTAAPTATPTPGMLTAGRISMSTLQACTMEPAFTGGRTTHGQRQSRLGGDLVAVPGTGIMATTSLLIRRTLRPPIG